MQRPPDTPLIAAIEGFAVAGGFGCAAAAPDAYAVPPVFASQDAREGAVAFAEKRLPVWRGR